jgi:tRNA(Arg) A34 adenosine deaminase TadA
MGPVLSGQILSHLQSLAPPGFSDLAFIAQRDHIYWSGRRPARAHEPHSAVTDLIQGIFQQLHDQSFFVLRERIFTSSIATDFDRAMVKVAAKRLTDVVAAVTSDGSHEALASFAFVQLVPDSVSSQLLPSIVNDLWPGGRPATDADWLKLCSRLADSVERGQVLHKYHRPIAALIVSGSGELLAASTHQGAVDKTQHAELRAAQSWFAATSSALPIDCRLYVSLKPCRMCAAAFIRLCTDPLRLRVIYLNDDPGPHARNTGLSEQSSQQPASALTVCESDLEAFLKPPRSHQNN